MMLLQCQEHQTELLPLCCRYLAVDDARSCFISGDPAFVPMHNPDTDVSAAPARHTLHAQGLQRCHISCITARASAAPTRQGWSQCCSGFVHASLVKLQCCHTQTWRDVHERAGKCCAA